MNGLRQAQIGIVALALLALAAPAGSAASKGDSGAKTAQILLDLAHPKGLERFTRQVSTPSSPHYRDYRTPGALIKRFGATKQTRQRALHWLGRHGLEGDVGPTRSWILAEAPATALPTALFSGGQALRARTGAAVSGQVPPSLRGVVAAVGTLSDTPAVPPPSPRTFERAVPFLPPQPPSSQRARTGTPEGCAAGTNAGGPSPYFAFTPNQYTAAYGHTDLHERGLTGAGQRVSLVEVDGFKRSDISTWAGCFGLTPPPITRHRVGPKGKVPPEGEANLDLEVLTAAAPGLDSIDVYTATVSNFGESLLLAVPKAFGGRKQTADVISMSLGECEAEQSESHAFDRALDHAFAIAGGAGISVLVASQDTGSTTCRTGKNGPGALPVLSPSFPATSDFVTAVGGTNVELDSENRIVNQITWNDKPNVLGASGGGTSGLFGRPWYQRGVSGTGGSRKGKGRAVPDVAALADVTPGYSVYCSRPSCPAVGFYPVGGTSAATPLLAGGVALANQAAEQAGQANLGFLNPLLYEIGTGGSPGRLFDDITAGNNDLGTLIPTEAGGGSPSGCCASKPGYDRATGLGAPDVSALSRIGIQAGG